MNKIHIIILGVFILIASCAKIDSNNDFDESVLLALLDDDDAMGIDGYDDGGLLDLDYDTGLESIGLGRILGDTLSYGEGYRIRFGRRITSRQREVDFVVDGDTAIGTVSYLFNGVFMAQAVDTTTTEAIDSMGFSKDFTSSMTRKIKFAKVDNANNPDGYSWRIIGLTPLIGLSGDKVSINSVDIFEVNSSLTEAGEVIIEQGEPIYSLSLDDIYDLYINRETLPTFSSFNSIIVKVNIENSGPEYAIDTTGVGEWVTIRYGLSATQRGRRRLNDLGLGVDLNSNDNVHSGGWRVHGPGLGQNSRVFRSFISVVDLATLFTEDGGYNSVTWSFPYQSQRNQ